MVATEEVVLTSEERLAQLGDSIISVLIRKELRDERFRADVLSTFRPDVFRDENHIIYRIIYKFREQRIVPDAEFIRMFLLRNQGMVARSSEYINLTEYADLDEEPIVAYIIAVEKHFTRLLSKPVPSEDELTLIIAKYKETFKEVAMIDAYQKAQQILIDGLTINKKFLHGYEDSVAYTKQVAAQVNGLLDKNEGSGFTCASEFGLVDDEEEQSIKVSDFSKIDELNEHLGGIYTPNFYSVIGPTKGGKSKFGSKLCHRAVVGYGQDVIIWAKEGGKKASLAQLRAIHYDYYYNENEPDPLKHKGGISQEVIEKGRYKNEEIRSLEDISRIDLLTNPKYGKIYYIDRPFYVEDLITELETAVKLYPNAKLIFIDYLQLIAWRTKGMTKNVAIGQAYVSILDFCKKYNVAVISPGQMTQEAMKALANSKGDKGDIETRTLGGESAEVIRTPDVIIGLYGTVSDIRAGRMTILSVPSRYAEPFDPIDIYVDLRVSMFASLAKLE